MRVSSASSSRRRRISTWQRDRSAALSSKLGFSVVAPTRVTVPSSTYGRKPSCCARLKRWISSTNSRVRCPARAAVFASAKIFLRSATPENTAEIGTKRRPTASASRRAMLVLPVPGGPHRIIDDNLPAATMRPIAPSGPVRCSCPTTSSSPRGRSLSASGAFAAVAGWACSSSSSLNRSAICECQWPSARKIASPVLSKMLLRYILDASKGVFDET